MNLLWTIAAIIAFFLVISLLYFNIRFYFFFGWYCVYELILNKLIDKYGGC